MKRTDIYVVELIRWVYDVDDGLYHFHETAPIKAFKNCWEAKWFIYNEYINKYNLKVDTSNVSVYDILSSSIGEEFRTILDNWFDHVRVGMDRIVIHINNIIFEDGEAE